MGRGDILGVFTRSLDTVGRITLGGKINAVGGKINGVAMSRITVGGKINGVAMSGIMVVGIGILG